MAFVRRHQRLDDAMSEIAVTARHEPVREGAIYLLGRIAPAFAHVDTSSGALSTAINRAIVEHALHSAMCFNFAPRESELALPTPRESK